MAELKLVAIFLLITLTSFSQEKGDFSIEYGVNVMNYNHKLANQYIAEDTTYYFYDLKSENKKFNSLNSGLEHNVSVIYQPCTFFDIGIYGSFQFSKSLRTFSLLDFLNPDENGNFPILDGKIRNATNAKSIGLSSNVYVNKLLRFESSSSKLINRTILSFGLKGLYGRSEFTEKSGIEEQVLDIKNFRYSSDDLNFKTEVTLGYQLFRKSFFSHIGVKFGYQLYNTTSLKDFNGSSLSPQENPETEVTLDFSGVYYGFFLRFGK